MNRRGFLTSLLGTAAVAFDPEKALWVPGKKVISIPSPAKETWVPFLLFNHVPEVLTLNGTIIHPNDINFKLQGSCLYVKNGTLHAEDRIDSLGHFGGNDISGYGWVSYKV
jgi:hypothetical protein